MTTKEFIKQNGLDSLLTYVVNEKDKAFPRVVRKVSEISTMQNLDEISLQSLNVYNELLSQYSPFKKFRLAIIKPNGHIRVAVKSNSAKDCLVRHSPEEIRVFRYDYISSFSLIVTLGRCIQLWRAIKRIFKK